MVFICFAVGFHSGFHLVFIVFIVSQWFSLGLHLRIGHPTQNKEMCRALPLTTRYVAVHGEQIDVTCLSLLFCGLHILRVWLYYILAALVHVLPSACQHKLYK
jgi:hypothetical protein